MAEARGSSTLHSSPEDLLRVGIGRSVEVVEGGARFTAAWIGQVAATAIATVLVLVPIPIAANSATTMVFVEPQNCSKMDFAHCYSKSFELNLFVHLYLKLIGRWPTRHLSKATEEAVG